MQRALATTVLAAVLSTLGAGPAEAKKRKKKRKAGPVTAVVLYFDNRTGNDQFDVLSKGMADMLITDLSGVDGLQLVERAKLEELLGEMKLQSGTMFDPKTAVKLGKLIGASHAIAGAFVGLSPRVRIDIRLVEVATGKVVLTSKVTGKETKFLDLAQSLAARFLKKLKLKGSKKGASGVPSVGALKAHGEALDLADRGNLKAASAKLSKLVRKHPGFKLAQGRYQSIMKRLYSAKKTRSQALSAADADLRSRAQAELKGKNVARLDAVAASRYLAYRVLLGNLELLRLSEILKPKNARGVRVVPASDRKEIVERMRAYATNTQRFIAELAAWRDGSKQPYHKLRLELTDADRAKTDSIGLGSDAGDWSFATPAWVARSLAEFIFLGKPDHYGNINFQAAPALADLDPSWKPRGWAHLKAALKEVDTRVERDDRAHVGARVLNSWALCLMAQQRKAEAISRWQLILDRWPTHEDFKDYEAAIRKAVSTP